MLHVLMYVMRQDFNSYYANAQDLNLATKF